MFKTIVRFILKILGFKKYDVKDEYPKQIVEIDLSTAPVVESEHFLLSKKAKKTTTKRKPTASKSKAPGKITASKTKKDKVK